MEVGAASAIGMGLAAGLAAVGAGIGVGYLTGNTVTSIARQPELKGSLMGTMFIGLGLVEAMPIIAIVIAFILMGNIGH